MNTQYCFMYLRSIIITYSFFNKLKTNPHYLNHHVNRRCDDLIEMLLAVEADMFFERKRKELLTTTSDASKKQEGDRHARGLSIDESRVHMDVCVADIDNIILNTPYAHRKRKQTNTGLTPVIQVHNTV